MPRGNDLPSLMHRRDPISMLVPHTALGWPSLIAIAPILEMIPDVDPDHFAFVETHVPTSWDVPDRRAPLRAA